MPFTPYHFGPGLLLKAVFPLRVSALAYCATQVAIDLEPGYYMFIAPEAPVHRGLHTLLGAAFVGLAVGGAVAGFGIAQRRLAWRRRRRSRPMAPALQGELAPGSAILGGIVGGLLHIALDAIMHSYLRPLRPFCSGDGSWGNPLAGAVSLETLHLGCVVAGAIGLLGLFVRVSLVTRLPRR